MRLFFAWGALYGLLGVAAGAFGAHALRGHMTADRLALYEVAVRYQMYHAFALIAAAWAVQRWPGTLSSAAGWLFIVGVLIFSGTVYALSFGAPRWLGAVTPIGGLCLLGGWLALAVAALRGL